MEPPAARARAMLETVRLVLVLALLLTVPGALLLLALGRTREATSPLEVLERVGLAIALSMAVLVLVGTALGWLRAYSFLATGLPIVEATLLAVAVGFGTLALRRARGLPRVPGRPSPEGKA